MKISGSVQDIRKVEDCIRGSGLRYLEYLLGKRQEHPVQGEAFPSNAFAKHYEVFLNVKASMNMTLNDLVVSLDPVADVRFYYDYKQDSASLAMEDLEYRYLIKAVKGLNPIIRRINQSYFRQATEPLVSGYYGALVGEREV